MSEITDRERFDFEREKWRADLDMRGREVAVKEREQAGSKWRNPLVVGVFAAALGAFGNAGVAVVNGWLQRGLESQKRDAELRLEESKAESGRILEMIKTGDPERAAANMEFLLKSGLVTNEERVARLAQYLKDRPTGTGPSLPTATGAFTFEPADALTKPIQDRLQKSLDAYVGYLKKVGFPSATSGVKIKVDKARNTNTMYSSSDNELAIGEKILGDVSVALQTFTYHVLEGATPETTDRSDLLLASLEVGLADYFTSSFLKNPRLGEIAAKIMQPNLPYLRLLENDRKFADFETMRTRNEIYAAADIWGGLFWAVRQKIGQDKADAAIAGAWSAVTWPRTKSERVPVFLGAIVSLLKAKGTATDAADAEALIKLRGFPAPKS